MLLCSVVPHASAKDTSLRAPRVYRPLVIIFIGLSAFPRENNVVAFQKIVWKFESV